MLLYPYRDWASQQVIETARHIMKCIVIRIYMVLGDSYCQITDERKIKTNDHRVMEMEKRTDLYKY